MAADNPLLAAMAAQILGRMNIAMPGGGGQQQQEEQRLGSRRSNELLQRAHRKALQDTAGMTTVFTTTNNHDTKPAADFPTPPPLTALTPIAVASLTPGTTHRGRILRGTLAADAYAFNAVQTLLEDEHGGIVKVYIGGMQSCMPSVLTMYVHA